LHLPSGAHAGLSKRRFAILCAPDAQGFALDQCPALRTARVAARLLANISGSVEKIHRQRIPALMLLIWIKAATSPNRQGYL
jgi:hypothetical protein